MEVSLGHILGEGNCDPDHVRALARAAMNAMEHTADPDLTSVSEVLSACFTVLSWMLQTVQKVQLPEDRLHNTHEIYRILQEMQVEFGSLPN